MDVEKDIIEGTDRSIEESSLKWYGHLRRMDDVHFRLCTWVPAGRQMRGWPQRDWNQAVQEAVGSRQLADRRRDVYGVLAAVNGECFKRRYKKYRGIDGLFQVTR